MVSGPPMFNSIIPVFGFKLTCAELKHTKYFFMSYRLFYTYVHCILFMCNFQCCMNYIIQLHMSKHTHAYKERKIPHNQWFPDPPRFCRLMKTQDHRHPQSSGMVGNKLGKSGAFLFSQCVTDFWDGWQSFPTDT